MTQDPNVTPHDLAPSASHDLAPPSSPGLAPPASHDLAPPASHEAPAIAVETLKATDTAAAEVIKARPEPEVALGAAKAASSELHTLLHNVGNAAEMPAKELRKLAHQLFEALGKLL